MIEKDSEWILPENLRKQEERERKEVDNGTFDGRGDFGSYYAYFKGINLDFIKPHAFSEDSRALKYVKNLQAFVNSKGFSFKGEILDVGCAIWTVTNSMNQLSKGEWGVTHGIDISEDGIGVAKQKYPNCIF